MKKLFTDLIRNFAYKFKRNSDAHENGFKLLIGNIIEF